MTQAKSRRTKSDEVCTGAHALKALSCTIKDPELELSRVVGDFGTEQ